MYAIGKEIVECEDLIPIFIKYNNRKPLDVLRSIKINRPNGLVQWTVAITH